MTDAIPEWCDRARNRMAELGITQDDLRETFGVSSRGAVGHYLSGRREPSFAQIKALADRLGFTTVDTLLFGIRAPAAPEQQLPANIAEPIEAYRVVRKDPDLIRELLAGVLTPLGLRLSRFEFNDGSGVRIEAGWKTPPDEHRRGRDAIAPTPNGTLPGEITRAKGGRRRAHG